MRSYKIYKNLAGMVIAGIAMVLILASCDAAGSIVGNRDELHDQVKERNLPSYLVNFDGNGATGGTAPAAIQVKAGSGTNLPGKGGLLKTGSIFAGWNTLANGNGVDYGVDELYTPEESTTLFAKWLPEGTVIWTVSFESEGITPFIRTVEHGEAVSEPAPQRTGYTFEYWSDYPDLLSAYNFSKPVTKNITLYAKWKAKTYNVLYNPNDGQGSVQSVEHVYDAPQNLLAAIFTRTGYTFTGWNTLATGGGISYSAEEEAVNLSGWNSGTVQLYAQWKAITYTVSYDANGSGGSAMAPSAFTYDVEGNLRNNSYTLANHEFLGWSKDSRATEATYTNRQGVTNLASAQGAVVSLFAIWKIHHYEVRFDTRGGNSFDIQIVDHGDLATRPSPDPERPNAVFDGWFKDPEVSVAFNFSEHITGNTTIYARWISDEWTVTFDSKGGSAVDAIVVDPHITTTINTTPPAPIREGYTFGGWFIDDNSFLTSFAFGSTVLTGSTTLYAKWTTRTYNVQYYPNGGAGSVLSVEHSYDTPKNLNYNSFERSNWTFAGWNSQAGGGGTGYLENETVTNLPGWNTGPVSLFAQWSCTVTFNKNNSDYGSKEADPQTKTVTTPATTVGTLPTAPSRTGWTFTSWNTASDGSGTTFDAGSTVTGNRTVYAQWSCTVTFNKNNSDYGSTEADPQTKTVTTPVTTVGSLPTTDPKREHYTFNGWNTLANGTGAAFTGSTTVTGNTTVYAKWTPVTYTVTFNKNGGDTEANPQTKSVTYPATTVGSLPTPPKRTGWIFNGWNTQTDGSGTVFSASTIVTGSISVYAQWIALDMAWIPAGTFQMDGTDSGGVGVRPVTLTKGFYMGKYQVTQEQYEAVMGTNPSTFKTPAPGETDTKRRPVEGVMWYDAVEFCNALSEKERLTSYYNINKTQQDPNNTSSYDTLKWTVTVNNSATGYRLPTEAQWEYACRAGTTTAFNWNSNVITSAQANYYASYVDAYNTSAGTHLGRTSEVGSYAPNAWGLYDMHGNVFDWCWDWYDEYSPGGYASNGAQTDPEGADSGTYRVARGGSWGNNGLGARSAHRNSANPADRGSDFGFRVVRP